MDNSSYCCNICSVKYQARPLIIYTSTKSEESFVSALQRSGTYRVCCSISMRIGVHQTISCLFSDGIADVPTVKLVRSSIFSYEQAWHRYGLIRRKDTYLLFCRCLSYFPHFCVTEGSE